MSRASHWGGLVSILLLTAGIGCGGAGGASKTYPVEGKVTFDGGGPLTVGEIIFSSDKFTAKGQIKEDGTFKLSTNKDGGGDGAPAGDYEVTIIGAAISKKDPKDPYAIDVLIDPKYGERKTSGLKYTVEPRSNSFGVIVEKPAKK